jgi:protein-disulfide isomerase
MLIRRLSSFAFAVTLCLAPACLNAQQFDGTRHGPLMNTSLLKPPAGSDVAIIVFEDLGCPACAYAHAIEASAAKQANVPLIRYDFPIAAHVWTFQAAVFARYLQTKLSPALADQFRTDVFAAQRSINNSDDLQKFTQNWFQAHGQKFPAVVDPDGSLARAVQSDHDLGMKINLHYTPTVLVVTNDQQQIVCGTKGDSDPNNILPVVQSALAKIRAAHAATAHAAPHKS